MNAKRTLLLTGLFIGLLASFLLGRASVPARRTARETADGMV